MTVVVVVCSHSGLWPLVDWMCPLKREQATRVSDDTLTHSRLYYGDIGRKSRLSYPITFFISDTKGKCGFPYGAEINWTPVYFIHMIQQTERKLLK